MASQSQSGSQAPRFLGRYELMYLLGQGGMGEVHLARLTGAAGFEKLCIVKTILPQMMTDPQFVDRFHHEAKVLTHLTHSNIAQVYDMGDVEETLYMAIEYVAGVDLSRIEDRVKGMNATVPVPIALLIGQQITEALGYAHRKVGADGQALGIVHRDVSPQNVMVSYEGEVKVIDFGLAKSTARSKHTMPSTVLGKLGYMSPEQAKGETVDHRSDIYSAGIVIWELLAGRPLFQGGTVGEMVAQMAFPKPVSLRSIRPEVSENLDKIVMRALSPDPAGRYNRADDFSRSLNELLVRENLSVSSEDVGNYVRSMCPEEFAAERHLQSKLSAERKKGGSSPKVGSQPRPPSSPASNQSHAIDGTMVRTPAAEVPLTGPQRALSGAMGPAQALAPSKATPRPPSQAPQARPPSSPMQPRDSFVGEDLKIPKSKAPLYAVLGLVVVVGGGAAGYFATRQNGVVVEPPPKTDDKEVVVAKVEPEQKKEEPAEVKKEEPVAEVKKEEPKAEEPARKIEKADVAGEALVTFRDKGDLWVKPGKKTKVRMGDELMVVGPAIPGSKQREIYGTGAIMEMKGAFGRVDEGVEVPKDKDPKQVFAVIEKGVDTRAKAAKAERAEKTAKTGPLAAKIEKTEAAKTEPKDSAKVAEVKPVETRPAEVKPIETRPVETRPAETRPAEVARPAQLVLKGRLTNEDRRGVILHNDTNFKWNTCEVRLPFKKFFRFEDPIDANNSDNIRHGNFEDDPREPDQHMKQGWALVRCREASGYIWWGKKMEL